MFEAIDGITKWCARKIHLTFGDRQNQNIVGLCKQLHAMQSKLLLAQCQSEYVRKTTTRRDDSTFRATSRLGLLPRNRNSQSQVADIKRIIYTCKQPCSDTQLLTPI